VGCSQASRARSGYLDRFKSLGSLLTLESPKCASVRQQGPNREPTTTPCQRKLPRTGQAHGPAGQGRASDKRTLDFGGASAVGCTNIRSALHRYLIHLTLNLCADKDPSLRLSILLLFYCRNKKLPTRCSYQISHMPLSLFRYANSGNQIQNSSQKNNRMVPCIASTNLSTDAAP